MKKMEEKNIVFFDGICVLCNGFMYFLAKFDQGKALYFSSLQGSTFQDLLPSKKNTLDSVIFYQNGNVFYRSEAIIRIFIITTEIKCLSLLLCIPKVFRDTLYNVIAHIRYRFFGRFKQCLVPNKELKIRFLP